MEGKELIETDITPKPEPITTPAFQVPAMPKVEPKTEAKTEAPKVVEAELVEPEVSAAPKNDLAIKTDYLKRITDIKNQHEGNNWFSKHYKDIAAHPDKEEITNFFKEKMEILLADEHGKEDTQKPGGESERNWEAEMGAVGNLKGLQAIWTACVKAIGKDSPEYPHYEKIKDTCKNELSKE